MRKRFKQFYDTKLLPVEFLIGIFKDRDSNRTTLVYPRTIFKHRNIEHIDGSIDINKLRLIVYAFINNYIKEYGQFHEEELYKTTSIDNIITSAYNGSNITWTKYKISMYVKKHRTVSSKVRTLCNDISKSYIKRHELRTTLIYDRDQLSQYSEGGKFYKMYMNTNQQDRIQVSIDSIQKCINNKVESINELTESIQCNKKELMQLCNSRDKQILRYYMYLVNREKA